MAKSGVRLFLQKGTGQTAQHIAQATALTAAPEQAAQLPHQIGAIAQAARRCLAIGREVVDQLRQHLCQAACSFAIAHTRFLRQLANEIAAQSVADLLARDWQIGTATYPRLHGVAQTGLLKFGDQTRQTALLAIVAQKFQHQGCGCHQHGRVDARAASTLSLVLIAAQIVQSAAKE